MLTSSGAQRSATAAGRRGDGGAVRRRRREEVVECADLGDDKVSEGSALVQDALRGPGVELIRPGDFFASGAELEKVAEDVVAKLGLALRAQCIAGGGRSARLWSTELVLVTAERSAPFFPEFQAVDRSVGALELWRRTARRRGQILGGKLFINRRRVEGERGGFVGAGWWTRRVVAVVDAGAALVAVWRLRAGGGSASKSCTSLTAGSAYESPVKLTI